MPIKKLVAGGAFSPEGVQVILEAYNFVVEKLSLQTTADKEKAGRIVVDLASKSTILDKEILAKRALQEW